MVSSAPCSWKVVQRNAHGVIGATLFTVTPVNESDRFNLVSEPGGPASRDIVLPPSPQHRVEVCGNPIHRLFHRCFGSVKP